MSPPPKRKRRRKNVQTNENNAEDNKKEQKKESVSSTSAGDDFPSTATTIQTGRKKKEPSFDEDELLNEAFDRVSSDNKSNDAPCEKDERESFFSYKTNSCQIAEESKSTVSFDFGQNSGNSKEETAGSIIDVTFSSTSNTIPNMSIPSDILVTNPVSLQSDSCEENHIKKVTGSFDSDDDEQNSQNMDFFNRTNKNVIIIDLVDKISSIESSTIVSPLSSIDKEMVTISSCILDNNPNKLEETDNEASITTNLNILRDNDSSKNDLIIGLTDSITSLPHSTGDLLRISPSPSGPFVSSSFISPLNTLDKEIMSLTENDLGISTSIDYISKIDRTNDNKPNISAKSHEQIDLYNSNTHTQTDRTKINNKVSSEEFSFYLQAFDCTAENIVGKSINTPSTRINQDLDYDSRIDTSPDPFLETYRNKISSSNENGDNNRVTTSNTTISQHTSLDSIDYDIMSISATNKHIGHVITEHASSILDDTKRDEQIELVVISDEEDTDSDQTIVGSSLDGSQDRSLCLS